MSEFAAADAPIGNLNGLVAISATTKMNRSGGEAIEHAYRITDARYVEGLGAIVAFNGRWHALAGGDGMTWVTVVSYTVFLGGEIPPDGTRVESRDGRYVVA